MVLQLDDVANTSEDALSTSVKKYDSKNAFLTALYTVASFLGDFSGKIRRVLFRQGDKSLLFHFARVLQDSGKLRTYPSPNPTLTPTPH